MVTDGKSGDKRQRGTARKRCLSYEFEASLLTGISVNGRCMNVKQTDDFINEFTEEGKK